MSSQASMGGVTGVALSIAIIALSWPGARRWLRQWTRLQTVKAGLSLLLYFGLALLWIPLAVSLTVRDAQGQPPSSDSVATILGLISWILLLLLWLVRYWILTLPVRDKSPPNWIIRFSLADVLCLLVVGACVGVLLAVRFG